MRTPMRQVWARGTETATLREKEITCVWHCLTQLIGNESLDMEKSQQHCDAHDKLLCGIRNGWDHDVVPPRLCRRAACTPRSRRTWNLAYIYRSVYIDATREGVTMIREC